MAQALQPLDDTPGGSAGRSIELLQGALTAIRGRSAARLPGFRDPIEDFETWLAKWKSWADTIPSGGGNPAKDDGDKAGSRKEKDD